MPRILILYGTSEGHTANIAKAISAGLRVNGLAAEIVKAGPLHPNPAHFDGVIVAASVHVGRYQRPVVEWVRANAAGLSMRPTALVTVCLAIANDSPSGAADVDKIVAKLVATTGWKPSMTKAVAGALLYTKYDFFKRWIMKRIASQAGGDTDTSRDYVYTDWQDLQRFTDSFARNFAQDRRNAARRPGGIQQESKQIA